MTVVNVPTGISHHTELTFEAAESIMETLVPRA